MRLDEVPRLNYADRLRDKLSFVTTDLLRLVVYGEQRVFCSSHEMYHQMSRLHRMLNTEWKCYDASYDASLTGGPSTPFH